MIYIIKFDEYVKIGYTNDPKKRISTIQVSVPKRLDVLAIIEGDRDYEKDLHDRFASLRSNGEWFFLDEEIYEFIEDCDNVMWGYGYGEVVKNELMPVRRLRIDCGLTMEQLGDRLGITRQGVQKMEQSANRGAMTLNSMRRVGEAVGHYFEFRFVKK